MNAGNLDDAEQMFEQALRVSPSNGKPYYYLGMLAAKQKDYERAMNFLEQAEIYFAGSDSWMSQVYYQEGLVFKAQGKKADAHTKFQAAVDKDATNKLAAKELNGAQ